MELMTEDAHRALAYIGAARRYGAEITVDEVETFIDNPPENPFQMVTRVWPTRLYRQRDVIEWLGRVRWIYVDADDRVRLTAIGQAMLRHAEAEALEAEEVEDVVLDPDDQIAYARAVERIASAGRAMLVDPYFRLDQLLVIVQHTKVDRLLTGGRGNDGDARLSGLSMALEKLSVPRGLEVRRNDEVHDRFVVPDTDAVLALGTSVGGIGRRFSVLINIKPPTADQVREAMLEAWQSADVVARAEPTEADADSQELGTE